MQVDKVDKSIAVLILEHFAKVLQAVNFGV